MPAKNAPKTSKSVKKRIRQTEKRTLRNSSVINKLKTLSKKVELEAANKNIEGAKTTLKQVISAIDKAVVKGIIHRNTGSRKVSRLTRLVNSLSRNVGA